MSKKRLQVVLDDVEYRDIERAARRQRVSVSSWVRAVLRAARRQEPQREAERKLAAVRAGARHSFPAGDLAEMLAEIEAGFLGTAPR